MYCKKCGCKLKSDAKICEECGAVVNSIEYCGGFWGLVSGEKEKLPPGFSTAGDLSPAENPDQTKEIHPMIESTPIGHESAKKNMREILLVSICIFLLAAAAVQTIRVSYVSKKLDNQEQNYLNLSESYEQLLKKYEEMSEQINNMTGINENIPDIDESDIDETDTGETDTQ